MVERVLEASLMGHQTGPGPSGDEERYSPVFNSWQQNRYHPRARQQIKVDMPNRRSLPIAKPKSPCRWVMHILLVATAWGPAVLGAEFTSEVIDPVYPDQLFPQVKMVTSEGEIVVELDRRRAPVTVNNFLRYVESEAWKNTVFHRVIDGFVVDCSEFVDTHPGGLRKLLSADDPATGATGRPFGFSFSRGRNAHFPDTGKRFREGAERYLRGGGSSDTPFLPPTDVAFPPYGKIVILGRLKP